MNALTTHQQNEREKRFEWIRSELPYADRGAEAQYLIGKWFYELRALGLLGEYWSIEDLANAEFGRSPTWAADITNLFVVRRSLTAGLPDGERSPKADEYVDGLNMACARVLKRLPPPQRAEVWDMAKNGGQKINARLLERIAAYFNVEPSALEGMTVEEQRLRFQDIDAAAANATRAEAAIETARLAIKRNRKVIDDMKKEPVFAEIVQTLESAVTECQNLQERLEGPLFRLPTAEEKLAAAISEANEDAGEVAA